ncbi:NAD(P)H-dependent oxidoreductase [Campylobacter gastrosuis]|uniref:NAD(P)H-dependent oxidoreductase n=1 Tax=Campylobacter gastrosuis TaxID=2974576 RepID=A0ABT7HR78_9BACT|nr:NAD(P)H-dependent oxidoreductase [Campylobacter gastrosuis]MDL0089416.1 NAD(P)H-dependent oxidoreductase [Campylobacter gastrosuis]
MKNVLIISGHPDLKNSVANATILDNISKILPNAKIRKLDELHKNGEFDIKAEQEAILDADIMVWQMPFYWYSMPSLMKKWLDEVFLHGFAHGSNAKIGGKKLIISITTGAPSELYSQNGLMKHSLSELIAPFESLASLCKLELKVPLFLTGISYINADETELNRQKEAAKNHANNLANAIKGA